MKNGLYPDGSRVLRAKIDMASPNMNLRDPALYRILHTEHHNTGNKWCIYPMYDYAHPLEDAFEGITHSLCSLEYEDHRPLYDWVIENCETEAKPRQIEFARLNMNNTIMSKRYLKQLVDEGLFVDGMIHVCQQLQDFVVVDIQQKLLPTSFKKRDCLKRLVQLIHKC